MDVRVKAIRKIPQVKTTNIVFTAVLIIAASALISMPQMIGLANAQSERASERACPVPGYTLERGECTAELIPGGPECIPSSVAGVVAQPLPDGESCVATLLREPRPGPNPITFIEECTAIEGSTLDNVKGSLRCTFPITPGEPTCPGGVIPTEEECITKPGQGNDPT